MTIVGSQKSRAISEILRQEILSGKFDAVRKMPSDRMLMRRFAVARATVQAAMKDLLDKKLVDRKPGYGTFLSVGASRRAGARLGLVVPQSDVDFYWRICRGVEDRAHACGWSVLAAPCNYGSLRERISRAAEFVGVCKREHVAGLLVQPVQFLKDSESLNRKLFDLIRKNDIPVVLIDSDYLAFPERSDYDLVCSDGFGIGHRLARHVIGRGARRIIYLSSPMSAPTAFNRAIGIANAVLAAGLPWDEGSVVFGSPCNEALMKRVFRRPKRPDAVICTGDSIAVELSCALGKLGLRVPDDVMIAGVNGDPVGERADPKITTAVQPCHQIGCAAFDMLLERIRDPGLAPRTQMFNAQVVVRESTDRGSGRFSRKSARIKTKSKQ